MKKRMIAILALAVLVCSMWAMPALAETYGTVVGGWLRLRANPSYNATVIASYNTGSVVTVLSQENGWARVMTADYRLGYMDQRYLIIGGSVPSPTAAPAPKPSRTWTDVNRVAYVTSQNGRGVRLRSAPEVRNGNVLGLYPVGRTVTEIRRSSDGWSYIRIDSKYGYMMSQFLVSSSPVPVPTQTVQPYPWPTQTVQPQPYPVSTATPVPAPIAPQVITSANVEPIRPSVGDTIKVVVIPSSADYTVVWYNDQNVLLSTAKTYKTREADAGHVINVRIVGAGDSAGFVADVSTYAVIP